MLLTRERTRMISIFRKEMRKWHAVLWVVFFSMALGSLSLVFLTGQGEDAAIASVNGMKVTGKDFKSAVQQMQRQYTMISAMYGIPIETIMKMFLGGQDFQSIALDNAIKDKLLGKIEQSLAIDIGQDFFSEELARSLPQGIVDAQGKVNMVVYENYLQRLSVKPAEFEKNKEAEFKRDTVNRIVGAAAYAPRFVAAYQTAQDTSKKSFVIAKFDAAHFKKKVTEPTDEELMRFYTTHKENYRIPERKQARVVSLTKKSYANAVTVDDEAIVSFYNKNKATNYRIPPKIKVRHIFLAGHSDEVKKNAESLLAQIEKSPQSFASLAKKQSDDKDTASNGGLTEFFSREGLFDKAFEKEAFKLLKKGELAPLVKTEKGFEIIMLDDRINASEKPLDMVRDEITQLLHSRKILNHIKSDLEALLYSARTEENAFDQFVNRKNLKSSVTPMLDDRDEKNDGYEGKLAERLFGKKGGSKRLGYFMSDDNYILYQVVATEKSTVGEFSDVKEKVYQQCLAQKATDDLKLFVKEIKSDLMNRKTTLDTLKGFKVLTTNLIKRTGSVAEFKNVDGLVERAFRLDDKTQISEFRHKDDIYLIQIENVDIDSSEINAQGARQRPTYTNNEVVNGFIASLQRNAKITVNETLMNAYKSL